MKFNKIGVMLLISMVTLVGCSSAEGLTGDNLINSNKDNLVVQGYVEAKEININTKVPGDVEAIFLNEGDEIKKGDVILKISSDTIQAKKQQTEALIAAASGQVKAAEAAKKAAEAQYTKAENGARVEEVAQAKAAYELAEKTYNKIVILYEENAIPESKYDEVKVKYEVTKKTYEMVREGAREEDKLAASALVSQAGSMVDAANGKLLEAKGGLGEVNTYLEDTIIKAPMDGVITSLNVDEGELVSTGMPLITLTNMENIWIELKVQETDLAIVEIGQEVKVNFLTYKDKEFKGIVKSVNKKPDFATKRATNNNGEFDILAFGVKVELVDIEETIFPGMTAIVDFGKRVEK